MGLLDWIESQRGKPNPLGALLDPQFRRDVFTGGTDAVNRGVVAGTIGGPVDAATGVLNAGIMGAGYLGHKAGLLSADQLPEPVTKPFLGSEYVGDKLNQGGFVSENRNPVAETLTGLLSPVAINKGAKLMWQGEQNLSQPGLLNTPAFAGQRGAIAAKSAVKTTIPKPQIPSKLSQKEFEGILQDIDGYGPVPKDDPIRKQEFARITSKLKKSGVDYIDMYHVTDAPIDAFKGSGIRGSEVDYTGRGSGNLRESSVYGFLDPDDIKNGYNGVLGAKSETPNVLHIKVPVDRIAEMRWDGNFNLTHGTYSGARVIGDIPDKWIKGVYKYDTKTNSVIDVQPTGLLSYADEAAKVKSKK